MPGKVATITDLHTCPMCSGPVAHVGGPIIGPGALGVLVNGKVAALIGDTCTCTSAVDVIAQGSAGVLFNGVPAVCMGDLTAHGGVVVSGQEGVVIGAATPQQTLALHKIPFPEITVNDYKGAKKAGVALAMAAAVQQQLREAAPVEEIPEDSTTVTLTSTFAREQLQWLAQGTNLVHFMAILAKIFGTDIPTKAYDELFVDAKNGHTRLDPTLVVKTAVGGGGAAFYYDRKNEPEIWVAEQFVREAATDNDRRGELMTALIEEFGHYLDYLLRNVYAETLRTDALRDEGASFAYHLYDLNPLEQEKQQFAEAVIDGNAQTFLWDYSPLHNDLKAYVAQERQNGDDATGYLEFYKAGKLRKFGQYAHGDIEEKAILPLFEDAFSKGFISDDDDFYQELLDTIYFGNWLRDMSQLVDPMTVRPLSNALDNLGTDNTKGTVVGSGGIMDRTLSEDHTVKIDAGFLLTIEALNPVKFSIEFLTSLVEIVAAGEFINPKDGEKPQTERYDLHLKKLREEYVTIDPDTLGVYRPEEHLDNPMGLGKTGDGFNRNDRKLYDKFVGFIHNGHPLHQIDLKYGMKKYLRADRTFQVEGVPYRTGYQYIKDQLLLAAKKDGFQKRDCQMALGAALHALEDFYAHTNYTEVTLMKTVEPLVYPWVDQVDETGYQYDYNREYVRMTRNSGYHVLKGIDDPRFELGGDHQIAAYIPIVTGTFGLVDTVASGLPIMNEVLFGAEVDPWVKSMPGDRTQADMLIKALCRELDSANNNNQDQGENGRFTKGFNALLTLRDTAAEAKDYIPDNLRKGFSWVTSAIGRIFDYTVYFTIRGAASIIGDAQTLLDKELATMEAGNFRIGKNPSHTQVAKDDTGHPLHELSALLAIEAVEKIAGKVFQVWGGAAQPKEVINLLRVAIRHPVATDWQDDIVRNWGKKNREKVCLACSPSVMIDRSMHALKEIDETLENVEKYVAENQKVIAQVVAYIEQESGKKTDAKALTDFLESGMQKSREQMNRLMKIKIKWEEKFPKPLACLPNNNFYTVKSGDTLSGIAVKGRTTPEVLIKMNHLINTVIKPGQRLRVPYPIR
ncbi:HET-C-related protein [Maribacter sp. 2-571]|uniref:HET-C-related protein n=1 Tax=Maribacter sp. 2-571 TaxID=3417569 RepID=UPI003D3475A0